MDLQMVFYVEMLMMLLFVMIIGLVIAFGVIEVILIVYEKYYKPRQVRRQTPVPIKEVPIKEEME